MWCNGNTKDFGSFIQGSNPCNSTKFSPLHMFNKIIGFLYMGENSFSNSFGESIKNTMISKTE